MTLLRSARRTHEKNARLREPSRSGSRYGSTARGAMHVRSRSTGQPEPAHAVARFDV